ncbi:MAG: CBS domain-containing protein [Candidatus Heimdallarchaeum endolithica]|uniref:CBS domain-containing protein n=1 Tax=Candidatus Heimdallarchaeum endolithica TaxID=2876572 RepID=A0A9Y1BTC1_9ARCH|nr:MAG: CBS domain-containing protein [Candidatus Heimdallarchaeum endolithica]
MTLREPIYEEPVTSVMTKGVLFIEGEKNLNDAVKIIADFDVGSVLVTVNNEPAGIITTKDIVKALFKKLDFGKTKIKEIMTSPLISISSRETISVALVKMKEKRINHLIVKDGEKIIGMLNPLNLLVV